MAPPDGAELKRTESYQYPAGHIGHLKDDQAKLLEQFKQLAKSKGYWSPATDTEPASHDDETMLRYLRARKFVPADAFKQFKDTEDWRAENHIDKLYEIIDIEEYDASRRLYPQWTGRRDKRGIPVYVFEIAHLDNKGLAAYQSNESATLKNFDSKTPPRMLRLFALYENLCRFALPLCSTVPNRQHPETPVSQSCNIVDVSGVSLMQFWKLKNHMQDASILATAHYPETLDRIFLLGAPSFFPTVWGWIKKWFDPITVSKIFILSQKETFPTLSKYIDIENIPEKYGGKLKYKFGDMPSIDDDITKILNWTVPAKAGERQTIPTGPIKWQHGSNGDLEAVAVGSRKGVQRNDVIATLRPDTSIAHMPLSSGRVSKSTSETAAATTTTTTNSVPATNASTASAAATATTTDSTSSAPIGNAAETSITGVSTLPFRDNREGATDKMADLPRQGTSITRNEQQTPTHAAGNASDGTPEVVRDGQGEKQSIMEPGTVGQAPKEHPVPDASAPPTLLEKVQHTATEALHTATDASQSVLAAVGLGGKHVEEPAVKTDTTNHTAIDGMEGRNVEEFLRAKTMSAPQA